MRDKTQLINKATIANIIYLIYHSEAVICPPEEDSEELIHSDLSELNQLLHRKLSGEEAEELFNLIIDYGEHCSEKCFEEGMLIGIKLAKEIAKI
ncbi:hypothetical protein [Aminipila sp.]|uniref:hypothetical protein n=1 Tax=Aminipila sp. TaxID=2060095 RepID=UPI00289A89A3|nr:hypothetical protein [Aminipila sp.]